MIAIAILFIIYYIERNISTSRIMTNESAWVYFNNNIRLACLLGTLGYTGLIIELNLLISLMHESTRKISEASRKVSDPRRSHELDIQGRRDTRRTADSASTQNKMEFDININDSTKESGLFQPSFLVSRQSRDLE